MPNPSAIHFFLRIFYKHFYNRLAFTYDFVSAIVSRGEWREWTHAAIPYLNGPRVLEVAFGTGNLLIDLTLAGFSPIGVDLSPYMIEIAKKKLIARGLRAAIIRARAQQLPFPSEHFDSLVMSFPPGLSADAAAMREMHRVLKASGKLVWIDAPYLYPRDPWSRLLNWALSLTSGGGRSNKVIKGSPPDYDVTAQLEKLLPRDGWAWRVERVALRVGYVAAIIGMKESNIN